MEAKMMFLATESDLKRIIREAVSEMGAPRPEEKEDRLLTAKEAAERLRISAPTLHRWKKAGIIPSIKFGGNLRFSEKAIDDFLTKKGRA